MSSTGPGCEMREALGCERTVPARYLMCGPHWGMVSKPVQARVYATLAAEGPLGEQYRQAVADAVADVLAATQTAPSDRPADAGRRPDDAVKCPSCDAAGTEAWIIFVPVANNAGRPLKSMPLNAEPDPAGNVIVTKLHTGALRARVAQKGEKAVPPEVTYCPHFATCKDSGAHRRRQRGQWTSAVSVRNADQRRGRGRGRGRTPAPPDILPGMTRLHPGDNRQ